jgi:Holliday junction resolvase
VKPGGSRAKGARGEKEVLDILEEQLGLKLVRNKQQTARGGRDISEDVDRMQRPIPFAIEVKFQDEDFLSSWWEQTLRQAEESGRMPVLFYRRSRRPWTVCIDPHDLNSEVFPQRRGQLIRMDLEVALQWMRERL